MALVLPRHGKSGVIEEIVLGPTVSDLTVNKVVRTHAVAQSRGGIVSRRPFAERLSGA